MTAFRPIQKPFPASATTTGAWNGQNLVGLDPQQVLLEEHGVGAKFSFVSFCPEPD
jgi:hypothetical protein